MKKALSLFLAVLMLCGCLGMTASAELDTAYYYFDVQNPVANKNTQCIVAYDPNNGSFKNGVHYSADEGSRVVVSNYEGILVDAPYRAEDFTEGSAYQLLSAPVREGYTFKGWVFMGYKYSQKMPSYKDNSSNYLRLTSSFTPYPADSYIQLPDNCAGEVVFFQAQWDVVEEEDTLGTILGILIKVFGAIIGILMYQGDTEAGAALMEKVLGGIL